MKKLLLLILVVWGTTWHSMAQNQKETIDNSNKLAVLWTSSDPEVAEKVCFMYAMNAKKQGWFDEVVLIIWGPSAKLLAENEDLQADIKKMADMGITVEACIACAKMYGVDHDLADLDIDVRPMGVPLTNYLKEGWHTLSF
ncbi:MAG: DsrE family protein [Mangrovibacterium sp.]